MDRESEEERDRRINELWNTLDSRHEGQIDLNGLKRGLKKMDHPLKNADGLVQDILKAVDTSGDGNIQRAEFRHFVQHAEKELWQMFQNIDRDHNGALDKQELRSAFSRAGVTVSNSKLDQFFEDFDTNRDGVISFEEWRDFLLFLPARSSNLRNLLSYYSATGNLNPEGDVHINETLQGLGTDHLFPKRHLMGMKSLLYNTMQAHITKPAAARTGQPWLGGGKRSDSTADVLMAFEDVMELEWFPLPRLVGMWMTFRYFEQVLTENTPQLGYFVSGGLAGVISRTATAPFDRLKVYLIAQTKVEPATNPLQSKGTTLQVASRGVKTLVDATKDLWRAGGMRSLFAGNGLNVVKVMPESAIKFGAYEAAKGAFARLEGHGDPRKLSPSSQLLSGGLGGMVAQCFVYPLDTLKFRMQCETVEGGLKGNKLILATAEKVWSKSGLVGFFRGLPLGLVGMFPYAAIDLTTFEYLKRSLVARRARMEHCHEDDVHLGNFHTGAIGAFSGALSASVVYPMNVLRTRMQSQGTVLHPPTYDGIVDVTRKTIQGEGLRGLYKGITPNLLKVVPSVSITYVVYENSKQLFGLP